jgi:hypothetical protein
MGRFRLKTAWYCEAVRTFCSGEKDCFTVTAIALILRLPSRSDAQAMTALGTTGTDDSTTAPRTHSDQKPMGTLAADDGRLKGSFHESLLANPVLSKSWNFTGDSRLPQAPM